MRRGSSGVVSCRPRLVLFLTTSGGNGWEGDTQGAEARLSSAEAHQFCIPLEHGSR